MIIGINDNIRVEITTDIQLQKRSVVQKEGSPNKGNEVWSTLGYYTTLDQLVRGLLGRHIGFLLPENIKDIRTLSMVIEEVGAEVSEKVCGIKLPDQEEKAA